jgi:tetratricopeptide (TPR) repeat protein
MDKVTARHLVFSILLAGFCAGQVLAQAPARVTVVIKDEIADTPIDQATVEISLKTINFKDTRKTNKKGQAIFTVQDAGLPYDVSIEADGYNPANSSLKAVVGKSTTVTFTLVKLNATPVATGEPAKLTPAQETFNAGVLEQQAGNVAGAKEKFLQAVVLDPKLNDGYSALAGIYLNEGNAQKALESALLVTQAEPGNSRGVRMLYEAQKMLGLSEEAKLTLEKLSALEEGGDAFALFYNEGADAARVGDFKVARERLEKALALKPDLIQATNTLMVVYINMKDYAKAASAAEGVLALRPDDLTAKRIRWDAYNRMGDQAKAQEAFAVLAAADPKVLIRELFGDAEKHFNSGKSEEALAKLAQILAIDGNHPRSHYLTGLCYVNLGQNTKAKEHLQKCQDRQRNDRLPRAVKVGGGVQTRRARGKGTSTSARRSGLATPSSRKAASISAISRNASRSPERLKRRRLTKERWSAISQASKETSAASR